jgi:TrmH family RNA methyltransferase
MGAHFKHPAFSTTWTELDAFRARTGTTVLAAEPGGETVSTVTRVPRVALIVGNEGAGLSSDAKARAHRTIALPLSSDVESLNVAVATGILLYLLTQ